MIEKKENAIYILTMPTVFREGEFRFYFFSREETRKHIHVSSANGEAKIWIEPELSVSKVIGLSNQDVNKILKIIEQRLEEINEYWNTHFREN